MNKRFTKGVVALVAAVSLLATACGSDEAAVGSGDCDSVDSVSLQLQWVTQAQFAGYFAAVDSGIYNDYCLDVTILEGGVDIVPQQQLASGAVDFAISWVPKALVSREQGADIVNVAQVFQRSGTLQVSWADAGIGTDPANLRGKKVGNWGWGNEFELVAGLRDAGVEDGSYEMVGQSFDMMALLNREIDAAQAMIYNEYAQVLEASNPATGRLYEASDLAIIDWNDVGTAMLQDAIWASGERLASDPAYEDITTRFVAGSLEGWAHCRDNADDCVEAVLNNGSALGTSHQAWQMNEINNLIWPSPEGAGMINSDAWSQTVDVATSSGDLQAAPDSGAYTNEYVEAALDLLKAKGVQTFGSGWQPKSITLEPGGE
ncbi:MAG: ABC transporter substrate-binding protein [Acidimicrobiales bacterium]|jgi:NitT/TauT family transport system substrate-binding protein|nr:ABC transporter substrate-binding protein [Acidimicrobiaceae bacterium]MDP6161228.1 ABC transporter substrate-binding protein [Acidimicrobiales bacterium]HJL91093.1 ABC transporter substrate-binding protein [Acidimicrobiales bacterium]HJO41346.1 ABC transporter substrate-binding protein [Acidimicrobiales bacterium]